MISPSSQGNSEEPTLDVGVLPGAKGESSTASRACGVFLMIDSLETGGSERQFSALARSLNRRDVPRAPGLHSAKGTISRRPWRSDGISIGRQLVWCGVVKGPLAACSIPEEARNQYRSCLRFLLKPCPDSRRKVGARAGGDWKPAPAWRFAYPETRARASGGTPLVRHRSMQFASGRCPADEPGIAGESACGHRQWLATRGFCRDSPQPCPGRVEVLRVGMIARMNTRAKNHHLFLRVAARLCERFPALQFVLVGDGPLRHELEREADDRGLGRTVLFLGDRRDIPAVLASLDISVLPSGSESLSNVILESMAAGVPVVAIGSEETANWLRKIAGFSFRPMTKRL